jgi:hypothetical protein
MRLKMPLKVVLGHIEKRLALDASRLSHMLKHLIRRS